MLEVDPNLETSMTFTMSEKMLASYHKFYMTSSVQSTLDVLYKEIKHFSF